MEYASGLIKLKPGSEDKVEKWRSTIASRLDEAVATHKDMRAKSIRRVFEVSQKLKHPIDKFHYDLMAEITAANIYAVPLIDVTTGQTSHREP